MPMLLLALNVVAALAHSAVGALPPHHPQHHAPAPLLRRIAARASPPSRPAMQWQLQTPPRRAASIAT